MEFGIQMWGLSNAFWHDTDYMMDYLVGCGYGIIEPDVLLSNEAKAMDALPKVILWADSLTDFHEFVADHSMRIDSVHVFGDVLANIDLMRDWRAKYGIRAVVHGVSDGPDDMDARVERYLAEAKALADIGLELWLHNVDGDLWAGTKRYGPMDTLLRRLDGNVFAQLDLGWAMYDGRDPVKLINELSPYLHSVHYKDLIQGFRVPPKDRIHTGLGRGALDVQACWEAARKLPVTHLLDQDSSELDIVEDARTGVLLLKYLELRSKLADAGIE